MNFKNINNKILTSLKAIPDCMIGKSDQLASSLSVMYSGRKLDEEISKHRKNAVIKYSVITIITIFMVTIAFISMKNSQLDLFELKRPATGEGAMTIPVTIAADIGDTSVSGDASLHIAEMPLSKEEIETKLNDCAGNIADVVPLNDEGKRVVYEDINLPDSYKNTGIEISWDSSDPILISEKGQVNVIELAESSEIVTLTAHLSLDDCKKNVSFDIIVTDNPQMYESSIRHSIASLLEEINSSETGAVIKLPEKLADGVTLKWERATENHAVTFLILGLICILLVYFSRYTSIKKLVKKYREEIIADFPFIIDKLVLLLNSGLTVFSALMKISDDYSADPGSGALATEVSSIGTRIKETNAVILDEWKDFAVRMESGDMLRFCTILEDNITKGGELVEKLETESGNMREMRRKNMQQHIRMLDSQMTLPMMMMLVSLVIVTVTPSMIQF